MCHSTVFLGGIFVEDSHGRCHTANGHVLVDYRTQNKLKQLRLKLSLVKSLTLF